MLLLTGLAPLVVLATGLVANPSLARTPLLKVPISKRADFNTEFIKRDWEHLRNLGKRGVHQCRSSTVNKIADILLNNIGGIYVANVSVGDPPTTCESCSFLSPTIRASHILAQDQLLVDSGSAITWVGANKSYVETKCSVKTKDFAVCIVSHILMTRLKRNLVHQNIAYSRGNFTGKFTLQEFI